MDTGRITELRLTAFKSYRDTVLPLTPMTVLIGRNGSGKSNALDGLEVLSRLAKGSEIRDALDGARRDEEPVRGGTGGCAPTGRDSFELGVSVDDGGGSDVTLDVEIQVRPQVQVIREKLTAMIDGQRRTLLETAGADSGRSDVEAAVWNGKPGRNPHLTFRAAYLLTAQLPLRLGGDTATEREVLDVTRALLGALGGVFHLDPVPQLMRQYVPEQDAELRRNGENLSATLARLDREGGPYFDALVAAVRGLPEYELSTLGVGRGPFGEVMLAVDEVGPDSAPVTVPARQMSDGMLRMIAILTALVAGGRGVAIEGDPSAAPALTLVLEELENGLHPTQAANVLRLVKSASAAQEFQVVLTTHSPALLDALDGDDHPGVLVVSRDQNSGLSEVTRLVDVPGYLMKMATAPLGELVTSGRLTSRPPAPGSSVLDDLLGIA